jgi:cytochrome P450
VSCTCDKYDDCTDLAKTLVWDGRIPEQEIKPIIALRDAREHTRRRRSWNRAFSTKALKNYETIICHRALQLVNVLTNQVGSVDLSQWISYFA